MDTQTPLLPPSLLLPALPLHLPSTSSTPKLECAFPCLCPLLSIPEVLGESAGYVFFFFLARQEPGGAADSPGCCLLPVLSPHPLFESLSSIRHTQVHAVPLGGPRRRRSGTMRVLCCFVNKSMLSATSDCHERLGICLSHWCLCKRG